MLVQKWRLQRDPMLCRHVPAPGAGVGSAGVPRQGRPQQEKEALGSSARGRREACKVSSVVVATRRNLGEEVGSGTFWLFGDPTVPVVVNSICQGRGSFLLGC